MPLPPPAGFPRIIPDTVGRDDGGWDDRKVAVGDDRILKVRRLLHLFCSWLICRE